MNDALQPGMDVLKHAQSEVILRVSQAKVVKGRTCNPYGHSFAIHIFYM